MNGLLNGSVNVNVTIEPKTLENLFYLVMLLIIMAALSQVIVKRLI